MIRSPVTDQFTDDDRAVLVEYEFGDDERLEMAVTAAFGQAGVDIMDEGPPLQNAVDVDALRSLHDGSNESVVETTVALYGHPVVVTSETIHIFAASDGA